MQKEEHDLLYNRQMPETDDIASLALKGHLIVEEMLYHVAYLTFPHAQYLEDGKLSFFNLAHVVRAAVADKSKDPWTLILKLNAVRNKFAHRLEPPELQKHLDELFEIDERLALPLGITDDKSGSASPGNPERLRRVVKHCIGFLLTLNSATKK